jgi:Na+-driven multidrug efflux pump
VGLLLLGGVFLTLWLRPKVTSELSDNNKSAQKSTCTSFKLSIDSAAATLLLALPVPALVWFLGYRLSGGASVIVSQYYGAGDNEKVRDAVHTTLILTFIFCAAFTVIGVIMVPSMLRLMSTPADVFEDAALYLRIYFYGVSGLLIYNMGSGILRAVGDSKRPLYFLIFSALVNTVLDLVFVVNFGWGVAGVSIATVIAQCLSAALVLIVLTRSSGSYGIIWSKLNVP